MTRSFTEAELEAAKADVARMSDDEFEAAAGWIGLDVWSGMSPGRKVSRRRYWKARAALEDAS